MKTKFIFVTLLITSIALNILFVAVELQQRHLLRSYYEMLCLESPLQTDIHQFHKYVLDGSKSILTVGIDIPKPQQFSWFGDHLLNFFSSKYTGFNFNKVAFNYGENSFLLNALIQESEKTNDDTLLRFVCKIFDDNVLILPPPTN